MKIPTHPEIDLAALQAVADAVMPGLATLSLRVDRVAIWEPDTRPKYAGCNKLAIRTPCAACNATGEVPDAEGYPAKCEPCRGIGEVHDHPDMPVSHVVISIGHRTTTEICQLSHVDGVHKNRRDLFVARTHDELVTEVRRCVGCAAFEVAKAEGGEPGLAHERAMVLLDAVLVSGSHPASVVAAHRTQRIAAQARAVMPELAKAHPTRPEIEVFYLGTCETTHRTQRRAGPTPEGARLDDHSACCTVTKITRRHSVDADGRHRETDSAENVS